MLTYTYVIKFDFYAHRDALIQNFLFTILLKTDYTASTVTALEYIEQGRR